MSFRYPDGTSVFEKFCLRVDPGRSVAIVGASGSGKSTLVNLILGFLLPQEGVVYPGLLCQSKRGVAYVPQDVFLSEGTLLENVALGCNSLDVDESWFQQVMSIVELTNWVETNSILGKAHLQSGGHGVSGGQRQRIGLARALYSKPRILLLDEATSALDSITELAVLKNLFFHAKEKGITIVFITHRDTPVAFCDTKIQLRDGHAPKRGD